QGLPLLVLALVMSAALGPAIHNVVIAISIPIIPRAARVIRSSVLSIREMQYVEAARALGVRHLRIAFRHVLPNTVGPFIVLCTAQLGSAILVEATLSFLGLGVPEPYPSWGRMLSVSAAEDAQKAPHRVLLPGIALSLAVVGSNLLRDALRDVLHPRRRGARQRGRRPAERASVRRRRGGGEARARALQSAERGARAMARLTSFERWKVVHTAGGKLAACVEGLGTLISKEEGQILAEGRAEALRAVDTMMESGEEAKRVHGETVALD